MYIVMLVLRYLLGIEGGVWHDLRLLPVRPRTPRWFPDMPTQPSRFPVRAGHVNIHLPIHSPLQYRRRAIRSSTHGRRRPGAGWDPPAP